VGLGYKPCFSSVSRYQEGDGKIREKQGCSLWGTGGREFKSPRSDQFSSGKTKNNRPAHFLRILVLNAQIESIFPGSPALRDSSTNLRNIEIDDFVGHVLDREPFGDDLLQRSGALKERPWFDKE